MTDTPRTDEAEWPAGTFMVVAPSFARTLERELTAMTARVAELEAALHNCRLLAAKHRKEEWAQHITRFCTNARVVGSVLRAALKETK
jgi:hypothetical protein